MTEEEFAQWFDRDFASIVAAVSAVCGSRPIAEEAVAEAFTRAFSARRDVGGMRSPSGWVYRVAVNETKMRWRRSKLERRWVRRQAAAIVPAPNPDPELWAAVAALPLRQREVIALRYLGSYTQPEIADLLAVSVGTVASTLHDARAALLAALDRTEYLDAHHH